MEAALTQKEEKILTTPSDARIKHLVQFKPNGINERRARLAALTLILAAQIPTLVARTRAN